MCVCARARVRVHVPTGGTISAEGQYTPYLAYTYSHGKMFNNLLAARCVISGIQNGKMKRQVEHAAC